MRTPESKDESKRVLTDEEFEQLIEEHMLLHRRAKTDPSIELPVIKGVEDMIKFNRMTEESRAGR